MNKFRKKFMRKRILSFAKVLNEICHYESEADLVTAEDIDNLIMELKCIKKEIERESIDEQNAHIGYKDVE